MSFNFYLPWHSRSGYVKLLRKLILGITLFGLTLLSSFNLQAEGSKDFRNYPGYRLFLDTRGDQQIKVYAKAGEFLNVGASHIGLMAGFIEIYRPDGTLHTSFSDPSLGIGVINNDVEEINGPTGGGSTNGPGYIPGVVAVDADNEGIWTVIIDFPTYMTGQFQNILNGDPWTRAINQPNVPRVVLAWDVTVSQNAAGNDGGVLLEGRVYSNEYISIINQNNFKTSPMFYVLTKDGFVYEVDFDQADPYRFPFSSNSSGFVKNDLTRVYASENRDAVIRSDDNAGWTPGNIYYYEPQAEDLNGGELINNKVFFNVPDPNMPGLATVTDVYRNNTHQTWLFNEPSELNVTLSGFELITLSNTNMPCIDGTIEEGIGGNLNFSSTLAGTAILMLDLNNDGDYDDDMDRFITQIIEAGNSSIFWNGIDGEGNLVEIQDGYTFNYFLEIRGGEAHIIMEDIENNFGGVTFQWMNNMGSDPNVEFFYDHSQVGGGVSGGGNPGNPLPTTTPFVYINNFGNEKFLDYWLYVPFTGNGQGSFTVDVVEDCDQAVAVDYDQDGIIDEIDIDDDNDGVPDIKEYCNPNGSWTCLPGQVDPSGDEDDDNIPNFLDANDPVVNLGCLDADANGICDEVLPIFDTDRDNVPDHLDSDSDNDGITDLTEAGHFQADVNGDGIIDGLPVEFGANGLYNPIASHPDAPTATETYMRWDFDTDGVPDHDDLDADNDGINDVREGGFGDLDTNNDGRIDDGMGNPPIVTPTGLPFAIAPVNTGLPIPLPFDKDEDTIPDWHDLDSDNDTILDVQEGGSRDPDNDGVIGEGIPIVNTDGQAETSGVGVPLSTTSNPLDTDNDGLRDFHDLDTDNDGINDVKEASGLDPDGDGIPGIGIPNVNQNGIPTSDMNDTPISATSNPDDTDGDGVRDFRDLDTDNDGINDVIEGGNPDEDGDGIIGTGMPQVNGDGQANMDENGDPVNTTSEPTDTDNDDSPDFRELDSDNDGISDVIEGGNPDPDNDNIIGEGVPEVNQNGQATADGNGDPVNPTSNPTDTDGDQTPDFQELDSDDDGLPDSDECPDDAPCIDGDGDGMPDFQDTDRDNDGISDSYECETGTDCPDTDGDGIPDVDDLDTDGDGLSDDLECPGGEPCLDADMNGIPNWREYNCNAFTYVPQLDTVFGGGIFCENEMVVLEGMVELPYDEQVIVIWKGPANFQFTDTIAPSDIIRLEFPSIDSINNGSYALILENQFGCPGGIDTLDITVVNSPEAPIASVDDNIVCESETIFLSSSVVQGTNITYTWYFDDGNGAQILDTTLDPELTIMDANNFDDGIYHVVAFENGCSSQSSNPVVVNVSNIASQQISLAASDNNLCVGEALQLTTDTLNIPGISYEWYYDDGTGPVLIATTNNPSYEIDSVHDTNSGIYTVLANEDECRSQISSPQNILVSSTLDETPQLVAVLDNLCVGEDLELSSTLISSNPTTYNWYFDDGTGPQLIETTDVPNFVVENVMDTDEGTYSVIANVGNCVSPESDGESITISDLSGIIPSLSVSNSTLCVGQNLELNTSVVTGTAVVYEWYFDDGNGATLLGTTAQPIFLIDDVSTDESGFYTVFAKDGNCISDISNAENVEITTLLDETPVLAAMNDILCTGGTIELNSSSISGGNVTYEWYFDNGTGPQLIETTIVPTLFIQDVTTSDDGIYTVIGNIDGCITPSSNAANISITTILSDTPQLTVDDDVVCVGEMIELNSTFIPGGNIIYQWFFDDGNGWVQVGTTASPTFFVNDAQLSDAGIYSVVASNGECASQPSNSESVTVTGVLDQTPTLTVNNDNPCQGELLELNSTVIAGGNVTYEWIFDDGSGNTMVMTTDVPTLFITDVSLTNTGIYTVIVHAGGCSSAPSNAVDVIVTDVLDETPTLMVTNSVLCTGGTIELNSNAFPGINVAYHWYFDGGNGSQFIGTTNNPTYIINNVNPANTGIYMVAVQVGGCTTPFSNGENILVTTQMNETPILEVENGDLCAGQTLTLTSTPIPGNNIMYEWYFDDGSGPSLIATTDIPSLIIEDVSTADGGIYTVLARDGDCLSNTSNARIVSVTGTDALDSTNSTDEDNPACIGDLVQLMVPSIPGASYEWVGPDNFTANTASEFLEVVSTSQAGDYYAIVSTQNCTFTSDPTTVYVSDEVIAVDDVYDLNINGSAPNMDLVLNDNMGSLTSWTISIITEPEHGTVMDDNGILSYIPEMNYFGEDSFVYMICDKECPDNCDEATVRLNISSISTSEDCFIPNIITPNGDNKNEFFRVPCLQDQYQNNSVKIFNRWGDEVHQAEPYQNDWAGTFKGKPLPAGTYFYMIWLNKDDSECLTGYFTITR